MMSRGPAGQSKLTHAKPLLIAYPAIHAASRRRELELVRVRVVAVARSDRRPSVARVVDELHAAAVEVRQRSLPPRQHRPGRRALHPQVDTWSMRATGWNHTRSPASSKIIGLFLARPHLLRVAGPGVAEVRLPSPAAPPDQAHLRRPASHTAGARAAPEADRARPRAARL